MITVQVTYTVNPDFVAQNKENINRFLEDFKQLDTAAFWYHVYVLEDGVTFLHFSSYRDETIQSQVLDVPSFKAFQKERDDSGLNGSHAFKVLQFVGASSDRLQLA